VLSEYKAGDRVIVRVAGTLTSTATLIRDPYISNFGRECVFADIDNEIGQHYIETKVILGYE
jgi:hypothetical protein